MSTHPVPSPLSPPLPVSAHVTCRVVDQLEDKLESDDRGYHANGDRALGASEANGDGASAAKITVLQEEVRIV